MRKLALAITAALALLAASFVSPIGALAASSTHSPVTPGPHSGARSYPVHALSGLAPATGPRLATLTCDAGFDTVASPNGVNNNELVDVSAVSANDIWAVGDTSNFGVAYDQTLAEHWDGTSWTIVPTSNPGPYHNDLTAVDAISTNDVWVVGVYTTNTANTTFAAYAQHWNGSSWTGYLFSPTSQSLIFDVTASSSNDVWAVGTYISAGTAFTLIEHWDGSAWTQIAGANPTNFDNELFAVSAFSSTDAWAVGEMTSSSISPAQSLAEHWDGTAWSQITTLNSSFDNEILWVQALEAGHAVGVGFGNHSVDSLGNTITPRMSQAWDLKFGPATPVNTSIGTGLGSGDNALIGVAMSGAAVWAVGYSRSTIPAPRVTLAIPATWNASTHTLTWGSPGAAASPGAGNSVLDAVTAVSPYGFWATGYQNSGTGFNQNLTESYCARHFSVAAPASTATSVPFSVSVTEQNGDGTPFTGYRGTVHFTSSDNSAVLPADYTFIAGDNGTHTFSGVVLKTSCVQSITAADTVMPFTMPGSASITVSGVCQSSAGTAGTRATNTGPAGTAVGTRSGANQSGAGTPGPRLPRLSAPAQSADSASSVGPSTGTGLATTAGAAAPGAASTLAAGARRIDASNTSLRSQTNETLSLVAGTQRVSRAQDQSLWYVLTLIPLLVGLLALGQLRRRRFKEKPNARN